MSAFDKPFDYQLFGRRFLDELLDESLIARPKREIELLVLRLILEIAKPSRDPRSLLGLARELRIPPSRLQSMLNELDFRDPRLNPESIKIKLRDAIAQGEVINRGGRVHIQIDDEVVRAHAIALVRQEYGVVDSSFRDDILVLSPEKYLVLACHALSEADQASLREKFHVLSDGPVRSSSSVARLAGRKPGEAAVPKAEGEGKEPGRWRAFAENFMHVAGEAAAKEVVELGFRLATGGLSDGAIFLARVLTRRMAA